MSTSDTFAKIALELSRSLLPLSEALSDFERFANFVAGFGWDLSDIKEIPTAFSNLTTLLETLSGDLSDILITDDDISTEKLEALLGTLRACFSEINDIKQGLGLPPKLINAGFHTIFPRQLLDFLLIDYLYLKYPVLAHLLSILGVIRIQYQKASGIRTDFMSYTFAFEDIPGMFDDPRISFRNAYDWGSDGFDANTLIEHFDNLLVFLRANVYIDYTTVDVITALSDQSSDEVLPARTLKAFFFDQMFSDTRFAAGLGLFALQKQSALQPGLAVLPFVTGSFNEPYSINEELSFTVEGDLDAQGGIGIAVRPEAGIKLVKGLNDPASAARASGRIKLKLTAKNNTGDPILLLGTAQGSRLEYKSLSLAGSIDVDAAEHAELNLEAGLLEGKVIIKPTNSDSFIQSILSAEGIAASFDLTVGISNIRGFYFQGSSTLELRLPVHVEIGLIEVQALTIGIQPRDGKLPIELGGDVQTQLGPLKAVVERIGLIATFSFSNDFNGNLGPLQLDLGFKPPDGLGLTIDGHGFSGGGFLRHIETEQRYEGMLELEYQDRITLKAIGLLTTRLPDGSDGFSLLIIITAEFNPPYQLGFGFKLSGVGGLLGLNRTANVERLRTGVKDNTLRSVLFPDNVIANANRIISDLNQVFPAQADRFIFGPMARITWGTPTLITIDLGLLIEVPDPVRVLILGVVRALLPDEEKKLLQLQVNFLGVIDFEAQQFSFDASLYDSKLLGYTLSGDMAVRLSWGADPNFLLTVGGFHPAYEPLPLNLPTLRRLSLQLLGGNPRLTLETYFAVTSNTVQFGAKVELYAEAGSFNVYGFLSFDVLFQFNPFYFIASISAKLALRAGSSDIASISLDFTLEGPTPWHAKGTAKLKLFWFLTIKVRFDKTFGEERNTRLDDVLVLPLLQSALSDKGNWEAYLPGNRHLLVSFKEVETIGDQVVVYPFGILTIQQRVVPLQIEIQKFGNQRPADGTRFAIEQVLVGEEGDTKPLGTSEVRELFAPAQFFELSDAQKLSSKSFERYDSGVKLVDSEAFDGDYPVRREVTYELYYIDEQSTLGQPETHAPDSVAFDRWALRGAIANSPLSHARNGPSALAPEAVQVSQEAYAVVNASDLRLAETGTLAASEAGAHRLMEGLIRSNPALDGEILVVPIFEVNHS